MDGVDVIYCGADRLNHAWLSIPHALAPGWLCVKPGRNKQPTQVKFSVRVVLFTAEIYLSIDLSFLSSFI